MERTISGAGMDRRVERPRAARRRWVIRGGIITVLLAAIIGLWGLLPGANSLAVEAATVRIGAVQRAPFRDFVPLRAEIAPLTTVYVTAVSGGQVAELIASDGQSVPAGAPLARLTNPQLELEVATRSADIAGQLSGISGQRVTIQRTRLESEREVADARNALSKAQTLLRQKQTLFDKGIVTRAAIDPLRDEVAYQQQRVSALDAGRATSNRTLSDQDSGVGITAHELRDSLAMVRGGLSALIVRAPAAGRLTAFQLQPGQTLKAGDPVGQVDSEGRWKLAADVDQYYLGRVHAGLSASADLDGRIFTLTLLKVLPQVTDGRFRVEFGFAGTPPAGLNRGQTIDVKLVLGADRPAVVAPAGGWLDGGGTTAFMIDRDGHAVRRAVATGRRNPDQVEVISGLSPGERIVTSPIAAYAAYRSLIIQ
ncbi:efflux RND transporter periplasmic adaptor subunit [uncultured Sphingomonas sp.]|uniref:efflux RND transporter periplasmic adaptor subunit n=1 Tax=uncultured Sphingomonas sp. TaxID=158754 RepID=UPI0035CC561F